MGRNIRKINLSSEGRNRFKASDPDGKETYFKPFFMFPYFLLIISKSMSDHMFYCILSLGLQHSHFLFIRIQICSKN